MSKFIGQGRCRKADERSAKSCLEFPLTPHASGTWQKRIRGTIHFFGRWAMRVNGRLVRVEGDGWRQALEEHKAVADELHAGRTPRVLSDSLTPADLCDHFLTAKLRKRTSGELGLRKFAEYNETTDLLIATFGSTRRVDDLAPDDFESLRSGTSSAPAPTSSSALSWARK